MSCSSLYLGEATAAAIAALISPTSVCRVLVFAWVKIIQQFCASNAAVLPMYLKCWCLDLPVVMRGDNHSISFAKAAGESSNTLLRFPSAKGLLRARSAVRRTDILFVVI